MTPDGVVAQAMLALKSPILWASPKDAYRRVEQAVLAFMGTCSWALPSLRLTAWGASEACFYGYLFCGLCPHPPETEFLDFQLGVLVSNA